MQTSLAAAGLLQRAPAAGLGGAAALRVRGGVLGWGRLHVVSQEHLGSLYVLDI